MEYQYSDIVGFCILGVFLALAIGIPILRKQHQELREQMQNLNTQHHIAYKWQYLGLGIMFLLLVIFHGNIFLDFVFSLIIMIGVFIFVRRKTNLTLYYWQLLTLSLFTILVTMLTLIEQIAPWLPLVVLCCMIGSIYQSRRLARLEKLAQEKQGLISKE